MSSDIQFNRRHVTSRFLDPRLDFDPGETETEVREDPLTGRTTRILTPRGILARRPPGGEPVEAILGSGENCLFCAPRVLNETPRSTFLVPHGRLQVGEALLFPNLFPIGLESAVCVYTATHDTRLFEFSDQRIADALRACRDFCHLAIREHGEALHSALYANFLSPSGSSVVHPHVQVLVDPVALAWAAETADGVERYRARTGRDFCADLVEAEDTEGRLIAGLRHFDWIAPFAPMGVHHIHAIGRQPLAIEEIPDHLLEDLAEGLVRVFRYYRSVGIESCNLILFGSASNGPPERSHPLQLHVVARGPLLAHGRNDATALERLFLEACVDVTPEQVAAEARRAFDDI